MTAECIHCGSIQHKINVYTLMASFILPTSKHGKRYPSHVLKLEGAKTDMGSVRENIINILYTAQGEDETVFKSIIKDLYKALKNLEDGYHITFHKKHFDPVVFCFSVYDGTWEWMIDWEMSDVKHQKNTRSGDDLIYVPPLHRDVIRKYKSLDTWIIKPFKDTLDKFFKAIQDTWKIYRDNAREIDSIPMEEKEDFLAGHYGLRRVEE